MNTHEMQKLQELMKLTAQTSTRDDDSFVAGIDSVKGTYGAAIVMRGCCDNNGNV